MRGNPWPAGLQSARRRAALGRVTASRPGARLALSAAALLVLALSSPSRATEEHCSDGLQGGVCDGATGICPAYATPGLDNSAWPVFQQNLQHTGVSPYAGPTCSNEIWSVKIRGKRVTAPVIGADGTLYFASAQYPVCAVNPANGTPYWCDTNDRGTMPDFSSPAVGNGGFVYVGTRANDLWAIEIPPTSSTQATVAWRKKVCTDGDITVSPAIAPSGVIYSASDSLGAGTLLAMCPGPTRTIKWCINPVGGGVKNQSPALSPAGDVLYVTHGGATLVALNPSTGQIYWQLDVETQRKGGRAPNYTPVVHPATGKIYLGFAKGLWEVTPPASLPGTPTSRLLYATLDTARERIASPPALDVARGTIAFVAAHGAKPRLYAIDFNGNLKWSKDSTILGAGNARNVPPVIDVNGNIYVVTKKNLLAFSGAGNLLFTKVPSSFFSASPILANGRLYAGTIDGTIYAIGDCP